MTDALARPTEAHMPRSDLTRLCENHKIRADFAYGAAKRPPEWAYHQWRVTLTRYVGGKRRVISLDFGGGSAVTNPTAADVVSSLVLDARVGDEDFASYCSEFGADPDSRKAEATWKACAVVAPKVHRFLGDDFNKFASAEH